MPVEVGAGLTAKLLEVENGQGYKVKNFRTTQVLNFFETFIYDGS